MLLRHSPFLGTFFIFNRLSITQLNTLIFSDIRWISNSSLFYSFGKFSKASHELHLEISSSCFWLYAYVVVPLWKVWDQTSITGRLLYMKFHLWIKDRFGFPRPPSFYHHCSIIIRLLLSKDSVTKLLNHIIWMKCYDIRNSLKLSPDFVQMDNWPVCILKNHFCVCSTFTESL